MADKSKAVELMDDLKRLLACTDRRREPRIVADMAATVHTLNPAAVETLRGKVINVSEGGLAVRLSCALFQGTEVQVICGKLIIIGYVKYSSPTIGGFHHGIEIDQMITFNAADSLPEILNLAAICSQSEEFHEVKPEREKRTPR